LQVAFGTDHGGFDLKDTLVQEIESLGHEVLDHGAFKYQPDDDYPDFAEAVARSVSEGLASKGVLLCGSGVGASIAANKVPGVRASVCHDEYSARQGVEHDDMNIICLGARIIENELAKELIRVFLSAKFSGVERHKRRLGKVIDIENKA
jgi:ribose 5-phosphate isomerase B